VAYVIALPGGEQARRVYTDCDQAVGALRRRPVGSAVWWCKYGRDTKVLVATRTASGVEMDHDNHSHG
jgi:hypothetical protein